MDVQAAMDSALEHLRHGRADDAVAAYERITAHDPRHAAALHNLGYLRSENQQFDEAISLIRQAIEIAPTNPRYFYTLALVQTGIDDRAGAITSLQRAVELKPDWPDALFALASMFEQTGQRAGAADAYRKAIAAKPDFVEAWINLGNVLQSDGSVSESIDAYREALRLQPNNADGHGNLGSALRLAGSLDAAIAEFQAALNIAPDAPIPLHNLGVALIEKGEIDQATTILRRCTEARPDFAEAWFSLGNALQEQRKTDEAIDAFRQSIRLQPGVKTWHNLGNALQAGGKHAEALDAYRTAIKIEPGFLDSHNNLGCLLKLLGRLDEAEHHLRIALRLLPGYNVALCNLGNVLKDAGQIEKAIDLFREAIASCPSDHLTHSNLAYSLNFDPRATSTQILAENLRWDEMHASKIAGRALLPRERAGVRVISNDGDRSFANSPSPRPSPGLPGEGLRLRIGYLGVDFREHCQSFFTVPLFEHHDRSVVELFCYADVSKPDAITARLKASVDQWRDIAGLSDHAVDQLIRTDAIDVLIDLTLHMSRGRPLVLARKPAPVQAVWLGYPGTSGLSAIDYRLTDPHLDPPEIGDENYSEISHRLPDTFWCYDPLVADANQLLPGDLPASRNGYVTFGCLNNFCKVNERTLQLWANVLSLVPDSRLMLLAGEGKHRDRLLQFFADRQIVATRIEFVRFRPREAYLRLYQQIDIGLDTVPYNGHTTSLDSFWMGVPVVTRVGKTCVGRAGFSQLRSLGMPELAAEDDPKFVKIASELAEDRARLGELRRTLRARMVASPLMDYSRFARALESFARVAREQAV